MSLSTGLMRWYPMTYDDTSSYIYDWSGYGRTLTNQGITVGQTGFQNRLYRSVHSTSNTQYLEYAANSDIATDTAGTIAYWINPGSATTVCVCEFYKSNNGLLTLEIENNKAHFGAYCAGWVPDAYSSAESVPSSTWSHVALTQTGSAYTIYINGVANTTAATGTWMNTFTGSTILTRLFKASYYGGGRGSPNGYVQDFRYYNRALSASEINALYYNGGRITNKSRGWY